MDQLTLKVVSSLRQIEPAAWDALRDDLATPFTSWTFLEALERCGCVGRSVGWWPSHHTVWRGEQLIAAAPAYVKIDSAGDFSRDWGLANAAARIGVSYYPKLIVAVPFTPVTGRRLLVHPDADPNLCAAAILSLAAEFCSDANISSINVLYHDECEVEVWQGLGLSSRVLIQFHWENRNYSNVDDWLRDLKSKKRTQARRERRAPAEQGIDIRTVRGQELAQNPRRWADEAFRLYHSTCTKFMWGGAYLNRPFYRHIFKQMSDQVELVRATLDGRLVAGAINIASPTHLYGRYWGCHEEFPFLHFNVCLYHSIDACIDRGLRVFEGGAGGQHKMSRGFWPTAVHSSHLFLESGFDRAVRHYLESERAARLAEIGNWMTEQGPRTKS